MSLFKKKPIKNTWEIVQVPSKLLEKTLDELDFLPVYYMLYGDDLFIAGGAVTRTYMNHPGLFDSDIDIFTHDKNLPLLREHFEMRGYLIAGKTRFGEILVPSNPFSIDTDPFIGNYRPKINLINYYSDSLASEHRGIIQILECFDINLCQMAYTPNGILLNTATKACAELKLLQATSPNVNILRIWKYVNRYGVYIDLDHTITKNLYNNYCARLLHNTTIQSFYQTKRDS